MIRKTIIFGFLLLITAIWSTASFAVTVSGGDIVRSSEVTTTVTFNASTGLYTYDYTVINTSPGPQTYNDVNNVWPCIVAYDVPLDDPSVVNNIQSPYTWAYQFISAQEYIDRYGEANPFGSAYVLHWYDFWFFNASTMIVPVGFNAAWNSNQYENQVNGFSFESTLSPANGPYATVWSDEFRWIGDPPLPGGSIGGGGSLPYTPQVPEPATMLLLGLGLAGIMGLRKKK